MRKYSEIMLSLHSEQTILPLTSQCLKMMLALGPLLALLLMLASGVLFRVEAQAPKTSRVTLVTSNKQGIVLEFTISNYQIETMEQNRREYEQLLVPGTVQSEVTGEPQLPTIGTLLGVPTIDGVSVEVIESEFEILNDIRLAPVSSLQFVGNNRLEGGVKEFFTQDETIYTTDAFFPDPIITIGQTAHMRDQPVVQVQFYPAQYNPVSNQVRLYRRILARITWADVAKLETASAVSASPAYEQLLESTLLNYGALTRSPAIPTSFSSRVTLARTGGVSPSLKIGVDEEGMYQLTYGDIVSTGFKLAGVDPRTLKLTNQGSEIPIWVAGEADGVFDSVDTVLFYGKAITDRYTTRNIYWLNAGGDSGMRMAVQNGASQGAPVPVHFPTTQRFEEDSYYWDAIPSYMAEDPWFWSVRYTAPMTRSYSVSLTNISTLASTATLRIRLNGQTDIPAVNPDHHTKVYLNGVDIEPTGQWWDGRIIFDQEVVVSQTDVLTEGDNQITLEGVGDTAAVVDQFLLNWIEFDYWDTYVAENDYLAFGTPTADTYQFEITNFTKNDIATFDVTNPAEVIMITDTNVISEGGSFKLQFEGTAQSESRYVALTSDHYKTPSSIELDQPSAWQTDENGADYIIITHQDFYTSALRLANHRNAAGLRIAVVKVEDIYDEFNAGVYHPAAIRDLLNYAYHNWQPPVPTYVLLVGDATYDPKDNYQTGKINYIPAPIVYTETMGETPSDNWFVTVDGIDIMPDMLIGRLSVETEIQADAIIDKIIQYEQSPPNPSWQSRILLVADDDSASFEITSEALAGLLPATFTSTKVYAADYPPGNPTLDIENQINSGSLLVNYTGHGNSTRWGSWSDGRIYERDDITVLANDGMLPVVTVANCLNGFFTGPFAHSLSVAEAFARLNTGGAAAVWAPTGLGYPSGHRELLTEFYKNLFQDQQYNLGAATTAAKISIAGKYAVWDELVETYVFFGDPAMPLAVPPNNGSIYLPVVIKTEH